ncbi:MAG: hypothetical protein HOK97_11200, partial [Deltaproteobacteria bacterium]|nr:hypothetical protein [Deltaproteobacteria bacterium]
VAMCCVCGGGETSGGGDTGGDGGDTGGDGGDTGGDGGDELTCSDTDNGAEDAYGDACEAYNNFPSWCGGYDDDDFDSVAMCCVCGGGQSG